MVVDMGTTQTQMQPYHQAPAATRTDFDAVVIGAGNAGLTAAATLQRSGARTLLVERHNVPGGCGTSFRRGRFEFEVALHQLSGVGGHGQSQGGLRGLLETLGVADELEFVEEHDLYRAVVPGVLDATLPADWQGAADAIEAAFPGNRSAVEKFFDLLRRVTDYQIAAMRGLSAERSIRTCSDRACGRSKTSSTTTSPTSASSICSPPTGPTSASPPPSCGFRTWR
jgi:phytoene dehydrogenase-like protein